MDILSNKFSCIISLWWRYHISVSEITLTALVSSFRLDILKTDLYASDRYCSKQKDYQIWDIHVQGMFQNVCIRPIHCNDPCHSWMQPTAKYRMVMVVHALQTKIRLFRHYSNWPWYMLPGLEVLINYWRV